MDPQTHAAHVLRKYDPAEWGGTETAVLRLLDGLRVHQVRSTVFCPRLKTLPGHDPFANAGHPVQRFSACVPVAGISAAQRQQLIAVGGNLMSFDLLPMLLRDRSFQIIHTHAGNRLGGIALTAARLRGVPLVATIHGGVLDLPPQARRFLEKPLQGGWEWGKVFGCLLRSRRVLAEADAILTCNDREAALQRERFPRKRILVQPHSVPAAQFANDCREICRREYPRVCQGEFLLITGRIDPVKNQLWVIEQMPALLQRWPGLRLVLAGPCTDAAYGKSVERCIAELGLADRVVLTGGLPPADPRLIGLLQLARAVVVPSLSETFGLVILEAWAAGTPVLATRTSGACGLVRAGENGLFFELSDPATFRAAVDAMLGHPAQARALGAAGNELVRARYDVAAVAARVRDLYAELIEAGK